MFFNNNPFDNKDKVSKYKYKIEENNECVKMCNETKFKYKIEEKKNVLKHAINSDLNIKLKKLKNVKNHMKIQNFLSQFYIIKHVLNLVLKI